MHLLTLTASLVSGSRIAKVLGISLDMAVAYSGHLEDAYLIRFLPFLSLKAAQRRRNPKKVHATDTGLRNAVCMTGSPDRGRLAETVVHQALRAAGRDELFYWRGDGEIDLAGRTGTQTDTLIQVAHELGTKSALDREVASLEEAGDAFPNARRLLIVERPVGDAKRKIPGSIEVMPLWRFLLEAEAHNTG